MSIKTVIAARGMLIAAKHHLPDIADRLNSIIGVATPPAPTPTDDALTARIDAVAARINVDPNTVDGLSTIATVRLDDGSIVSTPFTEVSLPDLSTLEALQVLLARIATDPNYMIDFHQIQSLQKELIARALVDNPDYATDYSELQELHARVDSLTPGTPESEEALRELAHHLSAIYIRIENDPDYESITQELDNALEEIIQQVLADPAYLGLREHLQRTDPSDFIEFWEGQATELPDPAANLQELSSRFIELPEQTASGSIEGHEELIATALAPAETAQNTASLLPDLTDIDIDIDIDGDGLAAALDLLA